MAETSDTQGEGTHERPTQAIFIGWLGVVLLVFAVLWALTAVLAGASHGFQ